MHHTGQNAHGHTVCILPVKMPTVILYASRQSKCPPHTIWILPVKMPTIILYASYPSKCPRSFFMHPTTHAVDYRPYVGSTSRLNWVWPVNRILGRICSLCCSHLWNRPHLAWSPGKRCCILKVIRMEAILVHSSPYLCQCCISHLANSVSACTWVL